MDSIINYLWEGSICLVLLYFFYRIFLTNHTFFDWNRTYLLLTMALALLIPALTIPAVLSGESSLLTTTFNFYLPVFEFSTNSGSGVFSVSSITDVLLLIYFTGVAVTFIRFLIGFFKILNRIQFSEKFSFQEHVIVVNPELQPSSFFHYIFLPEFDPDNPNDQLILAHERNHAAYCHTVDLLFFQLIKIVFWFHPILKFLEYSLCEVHEYQVDNEVTKSYAKSEYAHLLVNLIIAEKGKQLMNNFNQFQTKKRIMMMNRKKSNLMEKSRLLLAIPLMALLIAVFSCEKQEDFELILDTDESGELALKPSTGEIFDVVETAPNPQGGMEGWTKYLSENLSYPAQARKMGIEGTVYVSFVVEEDGTIQGAEILRGIGGGCDEAALKVIRNAPDWEPGKQRGQNVNVRMRVPIRFKLSGES